ncbi:cobalt-precorrin 5A hydrolase / precorrin-3B C17-methyltransferase [Cohaesibacter marisflavi]|uniref:Cobalt-precorrin 5A hydrolase / precorrin-3B C17-methyltransferase n=2 Tax=Cohaesibacter marisflavi TaxID=655353 RepID=A0A1I5AS44_9HYPH|nr:cobalt-precorrin 5A hydrolase / precorrin-3B C17-methyltransferase [Cohaesibacter marisflavi]
MEKLMPITIVCPSAAAGELAVSIKTALKNAGHPVELHGKGEIEGFDVSFADSLAHLKGVFSQGRAIVALYASGIVIRALAPLLDSKFDEPPVLAVARDGKSVVPLLGGHHGANDLAHLLAEALSAHAAVTTAGDCRYRLALDNPPKGWKLQHAKKAAAVMARIVDGEAVSVSSDLDWLDNSEIARADSAAISLDASFAPVPEASTETSLTYSPQKLVVGVGCERGIAAADLITHIESVLASNSLAPEAIGLLASIDVKMDEDAIHQAAAHFSVPARFFAVEELEAEKERLKNPSDVVFAEVGCHGVAEGAALAAAGSEGSLLVAKVKSDKATCAIGLAAEPFKAEMPGKKRGSLAVIGIGPGTPYWRTPEATSLIASAEKLVGYKFYLDLLGPMADDERRCDFPMGSEKDRCRYALEEAGKGHDVALICSGDGGIYAMGALVMELLDRDADNGGVSDAAKRVALTHVSGISALQAASARFGALLGHDFCTISLSDLLTPWETIEQRVKAAAEGDFVVAFYNPVSKKRRTQLLRAKEMLLTKRPEETPVLLASNLGRPDEELKMRTLATLDIEEVDMLTVVLVGSSQSRQWRSGDRSVGDNGWMAYTPRGYAKRIDGENRE